MNEMTFIAAVILARSMYFEQAISSMKLKWILYLSFIRRKCFKFFEILFVHHWILFSAFKSQELCKPWKSLLLNSVPTYHIIKWSNVNIAFHLTSHIEHRTTNNEQRTSNIVSIEKSFKYSTVISFLSLGKIVTNWKLFKLNYVISNGKCWLQLHSYSYIELILNDDISQMLVFIAAIFFLFWL